MTQYLRLLCVLFSLLSFSAMAPPADVPAKNIFKQPGIAPVLVRQTPLTDASTADGISQAASAPQDKASVAKPSGIDPVLAERKKKEELALEAKRKSEQERLTRSKADNCERAKLAKKGIESGVRLARTNAKGEREIMDDAARAAESQRIQSVIDADCK